MEPIPTDIASWFTSTAALAAVIVAVVAFLKRNVLKNLHDLATVLVSLGLGAIAGVGGHFLGHLDGGLPQALAFGVAAGFLASGGWDALSGLTRPKDKAAG